MKKIGITGTIASGKTSVSILLRRKGYRVFDCDGYCHILYQKNNSCYEMIVSAFGNDILDEFEEIDRKAMASLIFRDETKRKQLNSIVHPCVTEGMMRFFENHPDEELLFAEVPLLFEAKMESCFDDIVVVTCSKETAVKRMMKDRGYTEEEALRRYAAAVRPEEQIAKAGIVIYNDGSLSELNDAEIDMLEKLEEEHAA